MKRTRFLAVIAMTSVLATIATTALAGNPPGNNGTVKVDNIALGGQPNRNEPHVGCEFEIEWYGFDAGTVSEVTFEIHPPTGDRVLLTDALQLDGDDSSGGGSPAGLDAVELYSLAFDQGDVLHPQQGYHVKLTVNTTGSIGADVKHKVFWVTECDDGYPGGGGEGEGGGEGSGEGS